MIKSLLKTLCFIALILFVGQIQLGKHTIGKHFVTGVKSGCIWGGKKLGETKWFSGIRLPEFIHKWFETKAPPSRSIVEGERFSPSDREAMLRILK